MPDTDIVITEIMYDPDNSLPDNNYEWVEILNTGAGPVSLNGWTLDDSNTASGGVGTFPDVTLAAGEVAIFYNDNITEAEFIAAFNPAPGTVLIPVAGWRPLNNTGGDTVNLFNDQGTSIESVAYADDASPGQSLNYTQDGVYEGAGIPDPGIYCFTKGTEIQTRIGESKIETLKVGDMIATQEHGFQPIRWIGKRTIDAAEMQIRPEFRPVLIKQSAFGPEMPAKDTRLSQQHRICLKDWRAEVLFGQASVLCAAIDLTNDRSILVDHQAVSVEYYHILFDRHEIVFGDNLPSESFHPVADGLNALGEKTRLELSALFPHLVSQPEMPAAFAQVSSHEAAILQVSIITPTAD